MHRSALILTVLLLAAASPVSRQPDRASAAVKVATGLMDAAGGAACRVTGEQLVRDGTETLIDNDFTAIRTPGARIAVTFTCTP